MPGWVLGSKTFFDFYRQNIDFSLECNVFKTKNGKNAKFSGQNPIQMLKIMLANDSPPLKTPMAEFKRTETARKFPRKRHGNFYGNGTETYFILLVGAFWRIILLRNCLNNIFAILLCCKNKISFKNKVIF